MAPKIEKLPVPPTQLGEGPHWDSDRQTLYYVGLMEKTLNRYVPATQEHAQTKIDTEFMVSFIIPIVGESDLFVVNLGHKVHVIRWDGQNASKVEFVKVLAELDVESPKNMINDGKVDTLGRLFTGTIGIGDPEAGIPMNCIPTGYLYSITGDGEVTTYDSGIKASNGLAFDLKRKAMYHVDTFDDSIRRFEYDIHDGSLANKSILFNYKESKAEGYPDGMTIDTSGNLWVASFEGSCVLNINPDSGLVIRKVEIPDKNVTSVTFGGPKLDVLYVTTGYLAESSPGGGTYAVTNLGVSGYQNLPFKCTL